MKKQIDAKTFREDFHKKGKEVSAMIDKHFEELWKIAVDLQTVCTEGVRIVTPFGDFTFVPKPPDYQFSLIS